MEKWARSSLGLYVDFFCVCLDDDRVAVNFERIFKFTKVINGLVIRQEDMPTYGQLGCSGFIVIGADGACVSKKTKAFLDYGDEAFQHAEAVINIALEDAGVELKATESEEKHLYANGQKLTLEGISSDPTLNGFCVTVLNFDVLTGRFNVLLNDGSNRRLAVKPCSLAPLRAEESTASDDAAMKEIQPPNLVGCAVVDEEHVACTAAINECIRSGTRENLATLLVCLEQHFEHEEALASASGFGTSTDSFSPMYSHAKDHARILNLARAELSRAMQSSSEVDIGVPQMLASAFLEHAKVFDTLLEGNLQAP